ncbi:MAG: CotH kinase family protein, partial [Paramuribaculum sp.]|nr:CotH kinase family protein [Paramuribaculum sp.]
MKKTLISALLAGVSSLWAMADNEWIHIYTTSQKGTTEVESLAPSKISEIKYQEVEDDRYDAMRIFTADGEILTRRMDAMDSLVVGRHVPTMYINIENNAEVVVKDQYLNATISIEGNGVVDDFEEAEVTIKGRGNSTWFQFPKKPWRLKFAKKQEFCGLKKAKNFALIANFIDPSNMRNTVAF